MNNMNEMNNKVNKIILIVVISSILCVSGHNYSYGRRRGGRNRHHRGHSRMSFRGHRHHSYYSNPVTFFLGLMTGLVVSIPSRTTVVHVLPAGYRPLVLRGESYYYYDGLYYRPCPSGYIVVPENEIETIKKLQKEEEQSSKKTDKNNTDKDTEGKDYEVNIPNSDGSFTTVKLKKHKDGYIGPQGEFYPDCPSVKQLKVLYGK